MLFPFNSVCASVVFLVPCGVISLYVFSSRNDPRQCRSARTYYSVTSSRTMSGTVHQVAEEPCDAMDSLTKSSKPKSVPVNSRLLFMMTISETQCICRLALDNNKNVRLVVAGTNITHTQGQYLRSHDYTNSRSGQYVNRSRRTCHTCRE